MKSLSKAREHTTKRLTGLAVPDCFADATVSAAVNAYGRDTKSARAARRRLVSKVDRLNATQPSEPKSALKPDSLYEGDNGRIFCGELGCAGATAHFSGRTIAGQKVHRINADYVSMWPADLGPVCCENCKKGFKS